jgi:hypothetical protein
MPISPHGRSPRVIAGQTLRRNDHAPPTLRSTERSWSTSPEQPRVTAVAPAQPTHPESVHLAIAPDNVDPSRVASSIGLSLHGWSRGLVTFAPSRSGFVNRDPVEVTADGNICYESAGDWVPLVKLADAGTLRLEKGSAGAPSCEAAAP